MKGSDLSHPCLLPYFGRRRFAVVAGPGIVVMLADIDAGDVITAAQSGVESGYLLLLLQFILVPTLHIVQELAVRLWIITHKRDRQSYLLAGK